MSKFALGQTVWDFATQMWSTIVEVAKVSREFTDDPDKVVYRLENVPASSEYPDGWRNDFEIGIDPTSPHGTIYSPRSSVEINADGEIEISTNTLH